MSIGVQSSLELYTMIYGWSIYDKLWSLLTETGIAYIPFIGLVLSHFYTSYTHAERGADHALRSMEINLLKMMFIIYLTASPCVPLTLNTFSYTPMCSKNSTQAVLAGNTGTTYDNSFSKPNEDIRVPIFWYAVIAVSEGLTSAANTMVGCVPDVRKLITEVNMSKITDQELSSQIQDFLTMCYIPAKTQYVSDMQENNLLNLNLVKPEINKYGVDDTEWIGSHAFQSVYYQNLKASRPIPGFEYDKDADLNEGNINVVKPANGSPSCYQWWSDPSNGIAIRIYKLVPETNNEDYKGFFTDENRDAILKQMLSNDLSKSNPIEKANDTLSDYGYSSITAKMGVLFEQAEEYPKIYAATQAAPIIQALLLLMIIIFLPFALVFSSYRGSSVMTTSILIFSVIFFGFIWHLVSWVDKTLISSLYDNWFSQQGAGATLADMIICGLIVGAPIFWFTFMGAVGVAIGNVVSSAVIGMNRVGEQAASNGAGKAKAIAADAATLL